MSTDTAMLVSHEERIQQGETFRAEVAGNMAALTEQLRQVGEKVEEVGIALKERITELKYVNESDHESLRREVADLREKTEEHGKSLTILLSDRETTAARIRLLKKSGVGLMLTVLGAIATRWGEAIWTWWTGR